MSKRNSAKSNNNLLDKVIEQTLKTEGYLFPETIEEVKEFERIFGTTEMILPTELQEPTFLYLKSKGSSNTKESKLSCENFAMAAREGTPMLSKEIHKKIITDIKQFEKKVKKKINR
jgi:hypothetical protein